MTDTITRLLETAKATHDLTFAALLIEAAMLLHHFEVHGGKPGYEVIEPCLNFTSEAEKILTDRARIHSRTPQQAELEMLEYVRVLAADYEGCEALDSRLIYEMRKRQLPHLPSNSTTVMNIPA